MIRVLEDSGPYADADAFVADLNKARLANKGKWIVFAGYVCGNEVRIKNYGTGYLQILEVNGLNHAPPMDMNVTAWKDAIRKAVAK
jgi:hypothetical protein